MPIPDYTSAVVRKFQIARRLIMVACRLARQVNNALQQSSADAATKTAATTWLDATEIFCALVEADWDTQ